MLNSSFIQDLSDDFLANCKGKGACTLAGLDYLKLNEGCTHEILTRAFSSKFSDLSGSFDHTSGNVGDFDVTAAVYAYDPSTPEPELYVVGYCSDSAFRVDYFDVELTKDQLCFILLLSDILIVTVFIFGYHTIQYMQKDFQAAFDSNSVEARDFTVVVDRLPASFAQYKDELSLKHAIWTQIQKKIQECKRQELCPEDLDPTIAEINFGMGDIDMLERQREIGNLISSIEKDHIQIMNSHQHNSNRFVKNEVVSKAKVAALEKTKVLHDKVEILKIKYKDRLGLREEVADAAPEEIASIDELKVKQKAKDFTDNVTLLYITFASMQTKHLVERLFFKPDYTRMLRISEIFKAHKKLELKSLSEPERKLQEGATGSLYILEKPNPEQIYFVEDFRDQPDAEIQVEAVRNEPEIINWSNMKQSTGQRVLRRVFSLAIVGSIIGLAILALYVFTEILLTNIDKDSEFFKETYSCEEVITMQAAYEDKMQPADLQVPGTMACFCRQQFSSNLTNFFSIDFNQFREQQNQG